MNRSHPLDTVLPDESAAVLARLGTPLSASDLARASGRDEGEVLRALAATRAEHIRRDRRRKRRDVALACLAPCVVASLAAGFLLLHRPQPTRTIVVGRGEGQRVFVFKRTTTAAPLDLDVDLDLSAETL
jgi:hypothetical protein